MPRRLEFDAHRWLTVVVVLGAVLRFVPIWFGLPFLEARPDEETAIKHAAAVLEGYLDPRFYHWPSLTFYLFGGVFRIASLSRRLTTEQEYVIGRAIVAAAGTATIVVLFRMARRIAGEATAVVAAFFLAVAPLHVRDSHFAMTDVLMTAFATTSLALLLRAVDAAASGSPHVTRWFAAAGVAGGLATSTKYSGAAVLAAMVAAQIVVAWRAPTRRWQWRTWSPSIAFAAACIAAFFATTPYAILDYRSFAGGFAFDVAHLSGGHGGSVGLGWTYHLRRSLPAGLGLPIFVAALLGIVPMIRDHRAAALVLGAFCGALYAVLGTGQTVFFRYVIPLLPVACLSAGEIVTRAARWLAHRIAISERHAVALLAVLVAASSFVNSAWFDAVLARTDTRVIAGRWLGERVKPHESLFDAGGVYAGADLGDVNVHQWVGNGWDEEAQAFQGAGTRIPDWLVLPLSPLEIYTRVPPGLRRLAETRYALAHIVAGTRGDGSGAVYDPQDAFFVPLSGFSTVVRPGPTLEIYRRR